MKGLVFAAAAVLLLGVRPAGAAEITRVTSGFEAGDQFPIGVDLQVVIFGFEHNERYPDAPEVPETVLINPVITPLTQDMEEGWEGCLSVPGLRGMVNRYSMLRYEGFDQYGRVIDRIAEGFHARVVQHECDHLIGKLYPMRITDFSKFGFTEILFPGLDPKSDD